MMRDIREELLKLKDLEYKDFTYKLAPTVDPCTIIGIRVPQIREYAKSLSKDEIKAFLSDLPHKYYEEDMLHSILISKEKDFCFVIQNLEQYLPYVNNWAASDTIKPKVFEKHKKELYPILLKWMKTPYTYQVRVAIDMLMEFYLGEDFSIELLDVVASNCCEEYYINMMVAWYFATALAKQYEHTLKYLEKKKLTPWCQNKSIQKAKESFRITKEQKEYLETLKIK